MYDLTLAFGPNGTYAEAVAGGLAMNCGTICVNDGIQACGLYPFQVAYNDYYSRWEAKCCCSGEG